MRAARNRENSGLNANTSRSPSLRFLSGTRTCRHMKDMKHVRHDFIQSDLLDRIRCYSTLSTILLYDTLLHTAPFEVGTPPAAYLIDDVDQSIGGSHVGQCDGRPPDGHTLGGLGHREGGVEEGGDRRGGTHEPRQRVNPLDYMVPVRNQTWKKISGLKTHSGWKIGDGNPQTGTYRIMLGRFPLEVQKLLSSAARLWMAAEVGTRRVRFCSDRDWPRSAAWGGMSCMSLVLSPRSSLSGPHRLPIT